MPSPSSKGSPLKQHFMMFAAYNAWANARVYEAASGLTKAEFTRDAGAFFKSMRGTLNHLLVTDRIWMKRFTGEGDAPAALDTILYIDFAKLRVAREAEDKRLLNWVGSLGDKAFRRPLHLHDRDGHAHRVAAPGSGAVASLQPPDPSSGTGAYHPDRSRQDRAVA